MRWFVNINYFRYANLYITSVIYFIFYLFKINFNCFSVLILLSTDVTNKINDQISKEQTGRMFAIVQVCGKQFKVTENDIIIIEGFWPPNIGDRLKLEKVLLVGSVDFTLVGRPILNRELISIDATVIEKTLSHTKTRFRFRPRKQYRRINCKIPRIVKFFSFFVIYLICLNN